MHSDWPLGIGGSQPHRQAAQAGTHPVGVLFGWCFAGGGSRLCDLRRSPICDAAAVPHRVEGAAQKVEGGACHFFDAVKVAAITYDMRLVLLDAARNQNVLAASADADERFVCREQC